MTQNALTVAVPILPGHEDPLRNLLDEIGGDIAGNRHLRFSDSRSTHFARWVILEDVSGSPARLVFESNHDGTVPDYWNELIQVARSGLNEIYSHCAGYPGLAQQGAVFDYMRRNSLPSSAFYIGYRGRTVAEVKNALCARDVIQKFLDSNPEMSASRDPSDVIRQVKDVLSENTIQPPLVRPKKTFSLLKLIGIALSGIGILFTLKKAGKPILLGLTLTVIGAGVLLRRHEIRDEAEYVPPLLWGGDKLSSLLEGEDHVAQNQLTHFVDIKPGWFRMMTLTGVLGAIDLLARVVFNKGELGGIPTIHFARWVILDKKRLLFFSNYDGSWDNYLGDFVDKAHQGLTGVWSNTMGFPKTRFLLNQGALDIEPFEWWTRAHQVPTQVWYSAYPSDTVVNINKALALLADLYAPMTDEQAGAWLKRL